MFVSVQRVREGTPKESSPASSQPSLLPSSSSSSSEIPPGSQDELKRQPHHTATCLGLHLCEEPKTGEKSLLDATGVSACLPPHPAELPWTREENQATGIKGRLQRHTGVLSIIQVHSVLN